MKNNFVLILLAICILLNTAESGKIKKFKYGADNKKLFTCPINTFDFQGSCTDKDKDSEDQNKVVAFLKKLPDTLTQLKPIVDKILEVLKLDISSENIKSQFPNICLGDYDGDLIVNGPDFKPSNCDDLPLKTGDKRWGLLNIRAATVPEVGRIEFCVAFDLCGSLAVGINKDIITKISGIIPEDNIIKPFLAALSDFTISQSFSRNLEKLISVLQITKEENDYKSQLNPIKIPGNFHINGGLTLPFLDFRIGTISLGDLIAFEGKLGVMLDFGTLPDPEFLKSISKEISQKKNLIEISKLLKEKIKLGKAVCFFIDDGNFTIKLDGLTSGLIPDIGLSNADANVFFQFQDEAELGIQKGFYINLSSNTNFSLKPLIDKFLGQSIQGILDFLKISIPRENTVDSSLSITVTDDVTAVFLAIDKKYSIECYFPKGGKIGCKINDPGDNKFFTACKINKF